MGFELLTIRDVKNSFLVPLYQFVTLNYELFERRAVENFLKMISNSVSDRNGHDTDSVTDDLFIVLLD